MKRIGIVVFFSSLFIPLLAWVPHTYAGGGGILLPGFILRPSLDGAVIYDDNVNLAPDRPIRDEASAESDLSMSGKLQLSIATRTEKLGALVDLWGRAQRYQDRDDLDADEFGIRGQLKVDYGTFVRLSLYSRYAEVDRYDRGPAGQDLEIPIAAEEEGALDPYLRDRIGLSKRRTLDFGMGLDLNADAQREGRLNVSVRPILNYATYASEDRTEDFELNDTFKYGLATDFGWHATDKSTIFLTTAGTIHDSDAFERDATELALRLGARTRTTEKLSFRTAAGVTSYDYRSEGQSRTRERISYELGAAWRPQERINVNARAFSNFLPALQYPDAATYHSAFHINGIYRIARNYQFGLTGGIRREKYLDPVKVSDQTGSLQEMTDKYVEISTLAARLAYRPEGLPAHFYIEGRANRAASNDALAEYDANQVTLGFMAWY